jgi:hypothetical protein
MRSRSHGSVVLVLVLVGLGLGSSDPARADCPNRPADRAIFSAAGPLSQAGGQIVRFVGDAGEVVVQEAGEAGALLGFSRDGTVAVSLRAVAVPSVGVAPCAHTHVWMVLHDLGARTSRRLARLAGGVPANVRFSPTGRYVAVAIGDGEGASRLHLFDLVTSRRTWVIDGVEATWIDEDRFVLRDRVGRLSLHRRDDGERVMVVAPPTRQVRPYDAGADDTGFFATTGRGRELRFARVHLEGSRARIETRGGVLVSRPDLVSNDGRRGATMSDEGIEIRDLETGDLLITISGRPMYRGAMLSPDGATVIAISDDAVEVLAIDGSAYSSWGTPAPASEVVEPASPASSNPL